MKVEVSTVWNQAHLLSELEHTFRNFSELRRTTIGNYILKAIHYIEKDICDGIAFESMIYAMHAVGVRDPLYDKFETCAWSIAAIRAQLQDDPELETIRRLHNLGILKRLMDDSGYNISQVARHEVQKAIQVLQTEVPDADRKAFSCLCTALVFSRPQKIHEDDIMLCAWDIARWAHEKK